MSRRKKTEKDKERARLWRLNNPEKVRAQQERRLLRAHGLLEPYTPPPKKPQEQVKLEQAARMKEYHSTRQRLLATDPEFAAKYRAKARLNDKERYDRRKADPEAYKTWLEYKRQQKFIRYRLAHGIPLDAPHRLKITDEERARRQAEKERLKAERAAARPVRPPKFTDEERAARRREQQRAYDQKKRDLERQKRAAEVANDKANYPIRVTPPKVCPDPPELQALFAKASKGQPPINRFSGMKMGALTARAKWM